MATRKMKRYEEGGDIDEMEEANNRSEMMPRRVSLPPRALKEMGDASAAEEAGQFGEPGTSRVVKATPKAKAATKAAPKARDTGDESARLESRYKKPAAKYETSYDRMNRTNRESGTDFDSMVSKLKSRIAGASDRGQDRILTGMKKKADENKFMGSTGMKSGGKVSSASKRADGCAIKGKTRGKMM